MRLPGCYPLVLLVLLYNRVALLPLVVARSKVIVHVLQTFCLEGIRGGEFVERRSA